MSLVVPCVDAWHEESANMVHWSGVMPIAIAGRTSTCSDCRMCANGMECVWVSPLVHVVSLWQGRRAGTACYLSVQRIEPAGLVHVCYTYALPALRSLQMRERACPMLPMLAHLWRMALALLNGTFCVRSLDHCGARA